MLKFVELVEGWQAEAVLASDYLLYGRDWSRDGEPLRHRVLPLDSGDIRGFVERCRSEGATPWVEVGDVPRLREATRCGAHLWLRGLEAGGRCGEVGALVLIRAAAATGRPWVVQGLGPRAMGAARAVGAAGVVIDAQLWALPESPLHPTHKAWLARRSGRDTRNVEGMRTARGDVRPRWWSDPDSGLPCPTCISELATEGALSDVLDALTTKVEAIAQSRVSRDVLASDPFGTGRPVVQGPMANVAEKPGLARAVLGAGGLPFCALGALRPDDATAVLDGMATLDGPWGVGVIGFDVMPWRDAHLDAVVRSSEESGAVNRPVILAGGSPALATTLVERGLEPWLHTPSARLAKMALARGVPAVVFEGREAGGHVGQLTSAAAWEEGLAEVERADGSALAVLAGGIGDAVSAAFAATMAAGAFERGHRIGLQVGTALFFTHEIVESGQITVAYQQAALAAQRTVYVGDTVNLPLQCVPNRYTDQAVAAERSWASEGLGLTERRERVEGNNLGRTRIAAKGIERDGDGGYARVPVKRQLDEGAFTMGQGALVEDRLTTVDALFRELTVGAADLLDRKSPTPDPFGPVHTVPGAPQVQESVLPGRHAEPDEPIAIVGLGCVLPGGPDVPAFWRSLLFGMSAISPIPDSRWRPDRYFDPDDRTRTRTGVRMAGLVEGLHFDSLEFGIPPRVVASMDRAQQLALVAAREAIEGVHIGDRRRAAVVLGNSMGGEHAKSLAVRVRFREILAALDAEGAFDELDDHGLAALSDRVEARLDDAFPPVDVESMSGLLSNVIAGRVASWLDLMGGNTTVDAACAASLAAIETAVGWLRTERCDVVLTGGVDADLSPETYVGFSRTHALSGTGSSPFSSRADGFVMGEGAAVFVLKRLSDAERDGDRVWAFIRGIGQSSDGRSSGITAPRAEGQQLAIQRAYAHCDFGPGDVELIEAHGTGTQVGDRTELAALSRIFAGRRAWLGSVKSGIGHLKGGAGAAGLLKAVLALAHRTIPPTLNAAPLADGLARSPFRLPRTPVPFESEVPRASVSAFGFGGTNFHVLLEAGEAVEPELPHVPPSAWDQPPPELRVFAADDPNVLAARLEAGQTTTPQEAVGRAHRIVVLGSTDGLEAWVRSGAIGAFGTRAWRGSGPCPPAVLVFPGQGSPREGALDLPHAIAAGAQQLRELGVTDLDTSADPASQHALLVTTGIAWSAILELEVAGVLGHSVGELAALVAAGRIGAAEGLALAHARGRGLGRCPRGGMLAVALDAEEARELAAVHGLHLAAVNGPGSCVIAGPDAPVDAAEADARSRGIRCTRLDVERAFHTPAVQPAADELAAVLEGIELHEGAPWWSNVHDASDVARALVRAVTEPVGFQDAVERAAAEGHTLFLHVGPGNAMSRHVERTVPGATVVCLDPTPGDGGDGVVRAAAQLLALGHPGLLRSLPARFVTLPFPTEPRASVREAATEAFVPPKPEEAPEPSAPRALEGLAPTSDVHRVVLACIGEVTGYPPEALVSGARLDADLGIDSIRKMEIVGLVQDRLGIDIDDAELGQLGSLNVDGLVRWLEERGSSAPTREKPEPAARQSQRHRLVWLPSPLPSDSRPPLTALARRPLTELLEPWLTGSTPPDAIVLDADWPPHHGVDAFLAVAARESDRAIRRVFVRGEPDRAALARALGPADGAVLLEASRMYVRGAVEPIDPGDVPSEPVVLASGGTTGIVGACLAALPGARGVVFGRRPDQVPPEGFEYVQCDVTDSAAVVRVAEQCRARFGRIDLVVHAAGLLRDGLVETLTPEDAAAVVDVKVDGARHLIDATLDDEPLWVPFSSVSAHLANPAQSLYAGANATLEALSHPTATRQIPLAWTAWSGVGMASDPALQRLLASRSIRSLTPREGADAFVEALRGEGTQWIAVGRPPLSTPPWPLTAWDGADRFEVRLDPDDPALQDHRVAGRPLVPAAMWVTALLRAAGLSKPDAVWELRDLDIPSPCFVSEPGVAALTLESDVATVSRGGVVHCRARLARTDPEPGQHEAHPIQSARSAASLYREDLLFHGPAWQMLVAVGDLGSEIASADVHINGTDPLATTIDGAHQLLAAWSGHTTGWLGLPVGAQSWSVRPGPVRGPLRLEIEARVDGTDVLGEVLAVDTDGEVVARGTGVRLSRASRWRGDA